MSKTKIDIFLFQLYPINTHGMSNSTFLPLDVEQNCKQISEMLGTVMDIS